MDLLNGFIQGVKHSFYGLKKGIRLMLNTVAVVVPAMLIAAGQTYITVLGLSLYNLLRPMANSLIKHVLKPMLPAALVPYTGWVLLIGGLAPYWWSILNDAVAEPPQYRGPRLGMPTWSATLVGAPIAIFAGLYSYQWPLNLAIWGTFGSATLLNTIHMLINERPQTVQRPQPEQRPQSEQRSSAEVDREEMPPCDYSSGHTFVEQIKIPPNDAFCAEPTDLANHRLGQGIDPNECSFQPAYLPTHNFELPSQARATPSVTQTSSSARQAIEDEASHRVCSPN